MAIDPDHFLARRLLPPRGFRKTARRRAMPRAATPLKRGHRRTTGHSINDFDFFIVDLSPSQ